MCPLSRADVAELGAGGVLTDLDAFAVTPGFLATYGLTPDDSEDAERTLACLAGLAALRQHGRRIVAVATASATDTGGELGEVRVAALRLGQVSAWFADAPEAAAEVARAAEAVAGLSLSHAWDAPAHEALLQAADLLWHGASEWSTLL